MADDHVDPTFVAAIMEPMVEVFVAEHITQIAGQCHPVKDSTTWCAAHDSLWMEGPTCRRVTDIIDLCERAIIAWETRHGG